MVQVFMCSRSVSYILGTKIPRPITYESDFVPLNALNSKQILDIPCIPGITATNIDLYMSQITTVRQTNTEHPVHTGDHGYK